MLQTDKIFVTGHRGLVGSHLVSRLRSLKFENIVLATHRELELCDQAAVTQFFYRHRPDYVFHAAGKVGGILYNSTHQAEFLYENLMMACNVIHSAFLTRTKKLLYLGSSCIYPQLAPQPITESALLTSPLEPTNEGYALAKIAGLKLCEKYHRQHGRAFISAMPTNLYGPGDNFHPSHSHVIPGLLRRFHEAKINNDPTVAIWGTGRPRREFLYAEDLAQALVAVMLEYEDSSPINVGCGFDVSIAELAHLVSDAVGYKGRVDFDPSKPDGTPRKLLEISKVSALGWKPSISLAAGLAKTYAWALEHGCFS